MEEIIKRGDVFYANLDGDTYGLDTALAIAVGINTRKIIRVNLFKKFAHFLFGGNYNEYK